MSHRDTDLHEFELYCTRHRNPYPCPICTPRYCRICGGKFDEDNEEAWQEDRICQVCFNEREKEEEPCPK